MVHQYFILVPTSYVISILKLDTSTTNFSMLVLRSYRFFFKCIIKESSISKSKTKEKWRKFWTIILKATSTERINDIISKSSRRNSNKIRGIRTSNMRQRYRNQLSNRNWISPQNSFNNFFIQVTRFNLLSRSVVKWVGDEMFNLP